MCACALPVCVRVRWAARRRRVWGAGALRTVGARAGGVKRGGGAREAHGVPPQEKGCSGCQAPLVGTHSPRRGKRQDTSGVARRADALLHIVSSASTQRELGEALAALLEGSAAPRPAAAESWRHRLCRPMRFEVCILFAVLLNSLLLGIEMHHRVSGDIGTAQIFQFCSLLLQLFFVMDVCLGFWALGRAACVRVSLANFWRLADALLVLLIGVIFGWIVPAISDSSGALGSAHSDSSSSWRAGDVARMLQALRVVRAFGLLQAVKHPGKELREVWLLLRGFAGAGRATLWSVATLFLITYIFAVVGLAAITAPLLELRKEAAADGRMSVGLSYPDLGVASLPSSGAGCSEGMTVSEDLGIVLEHIGGVGGMMITLVQVLLSDSAYTMLRRIDKYAAWSWAFFYSYAVVASLVLLNLVTAVFVENTLTAAKCFDAKAEQRKARGHAIKLLELLRSFVSSAGGGAAGSAKSSLVAQGRVSGAAAPRASPEAVEHWGGHPVAEAEVQARSPRALQAPIRTRAMPLGCPEPRSREASSAARGASHIAPFSTPSGPRLGRPSPGDPPSGRSSEWSRALAGHPDTPKVSPSSGPPSTVSPADDLGRLSMERLWL